jgi:hypothetical protein
MQIRTVVSTQTVPSASRRGIRPSWLRTSAKMADRAQPPRVRHSGRYDRRRDTQLDCPAGSKSIRWDLTPILSKYRRVSCTASDQKGKMPSPVDREKRPRMLAAIKGLPNACRVPGFRRFVSEVVVWQPASGAFPCSRWSSQA